VAKLVDATYKNILEKFNPGARQLITAGKAYLKALHGASAASRTYLEALTRLAGHAEQSAGGSAADIGETLHDMVQTYSEIRNHELTLLKAFYVDLVAPLESNLEKDCRVVQAEQKRFTNNWRTLQESYGRAQVGFKKSQKKLKNSKSSSMLDKEIKQIQRFDEEKIKCEFFLENSLKDVMTQERRRYGFVLERQCSLAKHFHALHTTGESCLGPKLDGWNQVAQTRETLASGAETGFSSDTQFEASPRDVAAALRRNRSVDSSNQQSPAAGRLVRTRSNYELHSSATSLQIAPEEACEPALAPARPGWDTDSSDSASAGSHSASAGSHSAERRPLTRAVYAYLSSGEHQLSFHEGDTIACIGEKNKGWQFGENVRTHRCGWFPDAYTEPLAESGGRTDSGSAPGSECGADARPSPAASGRPEVAPLALSSFRPSPPGALVASRARPVSVHAELSSRLAARQTKTAGSAGPLPPPPSLKPPEMKRSQTTPVLNGPSDTSHHSSNDSGFGPDSHSVPPPQQYAADHQRPGESLPQTSRGWLIFSQGDNTELLRPYLSPTQGAGQRDTRGGRSVQFSGTSSSGGSSGGGRASGSASLLDHFVTIDRKSRRSRDATRQSHSPPPQRPPRGAKLSRRASLLRALRPGGAAAEPRLSSGDLWRSPGASSSQRTQPETIPEEGGGRSSPRSLSEADLLELHEGEAFLLVQDYRALGVAETARRHETDRGRSGSPPPGGQDGDGGQHAGACSHETGQEGETAGSVSSRDVVESCSGTSMKPSVPPRVKSSSRDRRTAAAALPLLSMNHVISDGAAVTSHQDVTGPISLPTDIQACAARRRGALRTARSRTVGACAAEDDDAGGATGGGRRRKHDTFSVFEPDAESEEVYYESPTDPRQLTSPRGQHHDQQPLPPSSRPAGPPTSAPRRPAGGQLRRHQSLAAAADEGRPPPSELDDKLARFNIDLFSYGNYLSRRLYLPEQDSVLEAGQGEEGSGGERHGPWYDLWGQDASCRRPQQSQPRAVGHSPTSPTTLHQ